MTGASRRSDNRAPASRSHRSRFSERPPAPQVGDNEQLEFLGDSILGFIVSEVLVLKHPEAREGHLSKWKAHLVSAAHLHRCALELGLGEFLLLGRGEDMNGGREKKALLSDALEALIAALYIDGGLSAAQKFIEARVLHALPDASDSASFDILDYKSALQERAQSLGLPPPRYVTVDAEGPEHSKVFTVEVQLGGGMRSRATGSSKKVASQQAARLLLAELNRLDEVQVPSTLPTASSEA